MLQTGLGQTNVTRLTQATTTQSLLMRTLNPSTRFVRFFELRRLLTTAGRMQRFVLLPRLQHQNSWFFLGTGALGTMPTRQTIFLGKTHLKGA